MADKGGAGSTLANLAAKRRQVQKTREMMGMGERGVQPVQRPIPGRVPAERPGPAAPTPAESVEDRRGAVLQRVQGMLDTAQTGGRAPMPEQRQYQPTRQQTRPLTPELQRWGAETLAPEMQFYRLTGRPPSPRELAIFQSRIELERQLKRPPTRNELKLYISNPETINQAHPRAFETD